MHAFEGEGAAKIIADIQTYKPYNSVIDCIFAILRELSRTHVCVCMCKRFAQQWP